jgi:hypothetical protein
MANTGERREINRFATAKESEAVSESKKLISRTKEISAIKNEKSQARRAAKKRRD